MSKYDKHGVILPLIPGFSYNPTHPVQQKWRHRFHWQKTDSVWHLSGSMKVIGGMFLSLVPYLISFFLVSHALEWKGMLFFVVRYQQLSVSRDWQMVFRLERLICDTKWQKLRFRVYSLASVIALSTRGWLNQNSNFTIAIEMGKLPVTPVL